MKRVSKINQLKAINTVTTLRKNGVFVKDALIIAANQFGVKVSTVKSWIRTHKDKATPTTNNTVVRNNTVKTTVHTPVYTFDDMSKGIRGVLKSILSQDGKYTIREANAAGKLYSAELSKAKVLIEMHKLNTKTNEDTELLLR